MLKDLRLKIARQISGHTQQSMAVVAACHETADRIAQKVGKRPSEIGL